MNKKIPYSITPQQSASAEFHATSSLRGFPKKTKGFIAPDSWKTVSYKAYPRLPQTLLPQPISIKASLTEALMKRKSIRSYSLNPILISELSNLLYYSSGLLGFLNKTHETRRFYPSAGARYPLEIYPLIFNVAGITPGGYHYHVKSHSIEMLFNERLTKKVFDYIDQPWIKNSAVIILVTSIFDRTEQKYGIRGYRHILTEYGHIAQNIYLMASALNIGACSIGGFLERDINRLLDLDYEDEGVVGFITLGKASS